MRKMITLVMLFVFMLMASIAMASQTGKTTWDYMPEDVQPFFEHTQEYSQTSKYKMPMRGILDLTVYRQDFDTYGYKSSVALSGGGEYDVNNGNWGVFVKCSPDISATVAKFFGWK